VREIHEKCKHKLNLLTAKKELVLEGLMIQGSTEEMNFGRSWKTKNFDLLVLGKIKKTTDSSPLHFYWGSITR